MLPRGTHGGWTAGQWISPRLTDAARAAAPAAASIEELIIRVAAGHGIGVMPESVADSLRNAGFVHVPADRRSTQRRGPRLAPQRGRCPGTRLRADCRRCLR